MKKAKRTLVCFVIAMTYTLTLASYLEAATLTIGSTSGSPGDKAISIPIQLASAPEEEVSAINFDLEFDTSRLLFKEVILGAVAEGVGKSLSYSQIKSNTIRMVVIGLNQNVIGDGVLLTVTFDILDKAPSGKAKLTITNQSASSPGGNKLSVTAEGGELSVLR